MHGTIKNNKNIGAKSFLSLLIATSFISAPAQATILWSTLIGGSHADRVEAIALHPGTNDIFITGVTFSTDFPTTVGAFDKALAPGAKSTLPDVPGKKFFTQDTFVSRLSADGKTLIFSTFLGGEMMDVPHDIVYNYAPAQSGDGSGGTTPDSSGPVSNGSSSGSGGSSTGLGKNEGAKGNKHPLGNGGGGSPEIERLVITGYTGSQDFPTTSGAFDTKYTKTLTGTINPFLSHDGFISVFDVNTGALTYSTFLGGDGTEEPFALTVAADQSVIVVGSTSSSNFPSTSNSFQPANKSGCTYVPFNYCALDGFVARLNLDATLPPNEQLIYSSYIGGTYDDVAYDVALVDGDAVIVGSTKSLSQSNFPVKGAYGQTPKVGTLDGFVMRLSLSPSLSPQNQLKFSSLLSGNLHEAALSVAVTQDGFNNLVIAGNAGHSLLGSPNGNGPIPSFITNGSFEPSYMGGQGSGYYFNGPMVKKDEVPELNDEYTQTNCGYDRYDIGKWCSWDIHTIVGGDIFLVKMMPDGQSSHPILYGTYFGSGNKLDSTDLGSDSTIPSHGLTLDKDGHAIIVGHTGGLNFPVTPGAINTKPGPFFKDFTQYAVNSAPIPFVSVFDMTKTGKDGLVYSTFLSSNFGYAADAKVRSDGAIVIAGRTEDPQFLTTPGVLKTSMSDSMNGFVTVIDTKLAKSGVFGFPSDNIKSASLVYNEYATLFGALNVTLGFTAESPTIGNLNYKVKLTDAEELVGKKATLFISPKISPPGQPTVFGETYGFLDLVSSPEKVLVVTATINSNGNATFNVPLTPGAITVGTPNQPVYMQAFVEQSATNNKYAASNGLFVTPHQ